MAIVRSWVSPVLFNDPISTFVDAEIRGWRDDGDTAEEQEIDL